MTAGAARRADALWRSRRSARRQLMQSLARLDANLQALRPGEDWGGSERFDGEQGLGLGDGTGVLQDLADLDELAEQLSQSLRRRPDGRRRPRQAGPPARRRGGRRRPHPAASWSRRCATPATCKRSSDGQLRLSPKAMRQLGKALLRDVADADVAAARASATCARPARRASCPARPGSGRSATPSRGTSPARSPTPCVRTVAEGGDAARRRTARDRRRRGAARPRRAPRPRSRCWSTRRSRWRWTAAGCR